MAPPRKHHTDEILDAARTVTLRDGPRATSVAAIAHESGAPAGTLYHRFRNRDGVLQATWLRALGRFHDEVLAAADHPDPVEAGVVRRTDLLDGGADTGFEQRLAAMNAPVEDTVARIARGLGRTDGPAREIVTAAVVDLPGAAIRRHARAGRKVPSWLEGSIAATARRLLTTPTAEPPAG